MYTVCLVGCLIVDCFGGDAILSRIVDNFCVMREFDQILIIVMSTTTKHHLD